MEFDFDYDINSNELILKKQNHLKNTIYNVKKCLKFFNSFFLNSELNRTLCHSH